MLTDVPRSQGYYTFNFPGVPGVLIHLPHGQDYFASGRRSGEPVPRNKAITRRTSGPIQPVRAPGGVSLGFFSRGERRSVAIVLVHINVLLLVAGLGMGVFARFSMRIRTDGPGIMGRAVAEWR